MLGVYASLKAYGLRAERLLAEKEAELDKRLKVLEDEIRRATLKLSFNLAILPGDQDIRQWHGTGCPTTYMPEDYVDRMGTSRLLSVRHFLPMLAKHAQELFDRPGLINAILALECSCVGNTAIDRVRAEVAKCLPNTKVSEFGTKVVARNEARAKVKGEAILALEQEKANQQQLLAEREHLAALIVPGVVAGCAVWIFLMALANVRRRRAEVAILRAIGYRAHQIPVLLLFRSLLGMVAGWIPALIAARQDPAEVLSEA